MCSNFSIYGFSNDDDSNIGFTLYEKIEYHNPIIWIQNYEINNINFLFIQTEKGNIYQTKINNNIEYQNTSFQYQHQLNNHVYKVFASSDSNPLFLYKYGNQTIGNLLSISKNGNLAIINIDDNLIRWINNTELSPLTIPVSLNFTNRQIVLSVSKDGILTYFEPQKDLLSKDQNIKNLLQDSRIVVNDLNNDGMDEILILSNSSDRYPHGALGDKFEAEELLIFKICENLNYNSEIKLCLENKIKPINNKIFESLSPVIINLFNSTNGSKQIGMVVSDDIHGSSAVIYNLDSEPVVTTQPIGKSFRWMLILGDGNFNGNKFLINETPHLTGLLKFVDPHGREVIELDGYSSHSFGSRNIDSAKIIKQDKMNCYDNNTPNQQNENKYGNNDFIVIPNLARDSLNIISLDIDNQVKVLDRMVLESSITSNTVVEDINGDGILDILVGDKLGNLYIFSCNQVFDR